MASTSQRPREDDSECHESVMRHKDVRLTPDPYGHLFRSIEAEVLERMSATISGTRPEAAAAIDRNDASGASVAQ